MSLNHLRCLVASAFILLFSSPSAFPQAPLEPTQMPSRTIAYLIWRGAPAGDSRKANSLLALWDDPDFAPVRAAMFENMTSSTDKDSAKAALTRDEIEQYSTLLENSFVIGYIPKPEANMTASAVPPKPASDKWDGAFFVYDRTGKESLLSKAVLRMRGQEKELPKVSEVTVAGVPALKVDRTSGTTYWVEHGKYAASANERSVLEEILGRLEGRSTMSGSLAQSEMYKEAQPQLGGGMIEFFARLPKLTNVPANASANGIPLAPALEALKLDAIHCLAGRVKLDGAKTRIQGAVLGDPSPGTLFDLWGNGQGAPESLALVPPNAVSYSESEFNFGALYEIIMRGVRAILPPGQQGGPAMVDSLAQSRLGMPLTEALGLLSGEFASIQMSPSMDPQKAVHILGIHKKPETLKLIHSLFGDQVGSERTEGDTTYLKVSLNGGQGGAGVAQWNFYHLAVTPNFILASGKSETLHELVAKRAANSAAVVPVGYQTARAAYSGKLDGVDYFDFRAVDWPGLKVRWVSEAKKASAKQSSAESKKQMSDKVPDLLTNVNPQVFPKHLHFMAGASWKDAKGIHFDQWLE
jgi:hypothetical protein